MGAGPRVYFNNLSCQHAQISLAMHGDKKEPMHPLYNINFQY